MGRETGAPVSLVPALSYNIDKPAKLQDFPVFRRNLP
jgi:hypothetical protein